MPIETPTFSHIENVPDIYRTTFYVDLANEGFQVVHGINSENFEKLASGIPYHRSEEPYGVHYPIYRFRTLEVFPYLTPYQPISTYDSQRLNIKIAMLGNRHLIPYPLRIKNRDFHPIGPLGCPGKSAHIDFTDVTDEFSIEQQVRAVQLSMQILMGKESDRTDALHITSVDTLQENGFIPFLAPIKNYPLHIRICDVNFMQKYIQNIQPTEDEKMESAERFTKLWKAYY